MKQLLLIGIVAFGVVLLTVDPSDAVAYAAVASHTVGAGTNEASSTKDTTPDSTTSTTSTTTTTTTVPSQQRDAPSDGETFAALVAIVGAILLGATVIWMVHRAHVVQHELASSALARGIGVTATSTSAAGLAGGRESGAVDGISVSGPELLVVGESGKFTVDTGVENPTWDVTGLTAYSRRNASPHRFELTPNETSVSGEVIVRSGDRVAKKAFKVNPAPKPPAFVLQMATRSWGLIVVAIAVVFGAVALGLTGRLDGGNFVALVAPLAALLGVTSIGGGRNDQTGGN